MHHDKPDLNEDISALRALLVTCNMHLMHEDFGRPLRRAIWLMQSYQLTIDAAHGKVVGLADHEQQEASRRLRDWLDANPLPTE